MQDISPCVPDPLVQFHHFIKLKTKRQCSHTISNITNYFYNWNVIYWSRVFNAYTHFQNGKIQATWIKMDQLYCSHTCVNLSQNKVLQFDFNFIFNTQLITTVNYTYIWWHSLAKWADQIWRKLWSPYFRPPQVPYWHGLTSLTAKMSTSASNKGLDEFTYPSQNLNCCTIEDCEWISNYIPLSIMDVIAYPRGNPIS